MSLNKKRDWAYRDFARNTDFKQSENFTIADTMTSNNDEVGVSEHATIRFLYYAILYKVTFPRTSYRNINFIVKLNATP